MQPAAENQKLDSFGDKQLSVSIKSMKWGENINQQSPVFEHDNQQHHNHNQQHHNHNQQHHNHNQQHQNQFAATYNDGPAYAGSYAEKPDKLDSLKQDYERIKRLNVQESIVYSTSKQQSEQSDSSSMHSGSRRGKNSHHHQKFLHLENRQLQIMLDNSMQRIEELLNSEVQYKIKIHQLQTGVRANSKPEDSLTKHADEHRSLMQKLDNSQQEEQQLQKQIVNLNKQLEALQSSVAGKQAQIDKLNFQKRKVYEDAYVNQQKMLVMQMEIKGLKMEMEMLERDRVSQIDFWKRMVEQQRTNQAEHPNGSVIEELKQQIELKNHRYQLLLSKVEQQGNIRGAERLAHKNLAAKIDRLPEDENLRKEIEELREHFMQLEAAGNLDLDSRVKFLENFIEAENKQKVSFINEMDMMSRNFQQLEEQNKKLRQELNNQQTQKHKLQIQVEKFKSDLGVSPHANLVLSGSQTDPEFRQNIKRLERYQHELMQQRAENKELTETYRVHQTAFQEEIRCLKRQNSELSFSLDKLSKQSTCNTQLYEAKLTAERELSRTQIQRVMQQRDEWKRQFSNMKKYYEDQLRKLMRDMRTVSQEFYKALEARDSELLKVRGLVDGNMKQARNKFQQEQSGLLSRLESLMQSNETFAKENAKLVRLESEFYDLRQHNKQMYGLTTNIDHLWSVKETEYGNVNGILQSLI